MTKSQKLQAKAVIAVVLAGTLAVFLFRTELFPFSRYAMYSEVNQKDEFLLLEIRGVDESGKEFEIKSHEIFWPFYNLSFYLAFQRLRKDHGPDFIRFYQLRRLAMPEKYPPANKIRVYRNTWNIERLSKAIQDGVKSQIFTPDQRTLLEEISL